MEINKDMTIAEILRADVDLIPILLETGMQWLNPDTAQEESIEMVCIRSGIDADALVERMNAVLSAKTI